MTLPYPIDPALPSNPNPFFRDNNFVRGPEFRSNNQQIWGNFNGVEADIAAVQTNLDVIAGFRSREVSGFRFSRNAANPNTHVDFLTGGNCWSDDLTTYIRKDISMTKRVDQAFAEGTNNGAYVISLIHTATRASSGTVRTLTFATPHGIADAISMDISGLPSAYNVTNVTVVATDRFTITYTGVGSLTESQTADTAGIVQVSTAPGIDFTTVKNLHWFAIWGPTKTEDYCYSPIRYNPVLPPGFTKKRWIGSYRPNNTVLGLPTYVETLTRDSTLILRNTSMQNAGNPPGPTLNTSSTALSVAPSSNGIAPLGFLNASVNMLIEGGNASAIFLWFLDYDHAAPGTPTNISNNLAWVANGRNMIMHEIFYNWDGNFVVRASGTVNSGEYQMRIARVLMARNILD